MIHSPAGLLLSFTLYLISITSKLSNKKEKEKKRDIITHLSSHFHFVFTSKLQNTSRLFHHQLMVMFTSADELMKRVVCKRKNKKVHS
jgi:hypothetical protein